MKNVNNFKLSVIPWEAEPDWREDLRLAQTALDMGFVVESCDFTHGTVPANPLSFVWGDTHIWLCRKGWAAAERLSGGYTGHRYYGTLEEALDGEKHPHEIVFLGIDQNWQDEITNYWFRVGGWECAISDNNGLLALLDADGVPVEPCNDHGRMLERLMPFYDEMKGKPKKIPRAHQRPNYTVINKAKIRSYFAQKQGQNESGGSRRSPVPHIRRKHIRRLVSGPGKRWKQDKVIIVPAKFIGNATEYRDGNKIYKVRVDL